MARKPTDTVQLKLRYPEVVRRQLASKAKANRRSMNTEIIERLVRTLREDWFEEKREREETLERAVERIEKAGFKVARLPPKKPEEKQGDEGHHVPAAIDNTEQSEDVSAALKQIREELHQIRTELHELRLAPSQITANTSITRLE